MIRENVISRQVYLPLRDVLRRACTVLNVCVPTRFTAPVHRCGETGSLTEISIKMRLKGGPGVGLVPQPGDP